MRQDVILKTRAKKSLQARKKCPAAPQNRRDAGFFSVDVQQFSIDVRFFSVDVRFFPAAREIFSCGRKIFPCGRSKKYCRGALRVKKRLFSVKNAALHAFSDVQFTSMDGICARKCQSEKYLQRPSRFVPVFRTPPQGLTKNGTHLALSEINV